MKVARELLITELLQDELGIAVCGTSCVGPVVDAVAVEIGE